MRNWIIVLLLLFCSLAAQELTLSKETYHVKPPAGNCPTCSYDTITIKNNGAEPVTLDSVRLEMEGLDTIPEFGKPIYPMTYLRINETFGEGEWGINIWNLDSLGNNIYRCIIDSTLLTSTNNLSIGASGDSIRLTFVIIGSCLNCAAVYTLPFSSAVAQLFYSNGQTVELELEYGNSTGAVTQHNSPKRIRNAQVQTVSGESIFLANGKRVPSPKDKLTKGTGTHLLISTINRCRRLVLSEKK